MVKLEKIGSKWPQIYIFKAPPYKILLKYSWEPVNINDKFMKEFRFVLNFTRFDHFYEKHAFLGFNPTSHGGGDNTSPLVFDFE